MLQRVHRLLTDFSCSSRVPYVTLKPLFSATERVAKLNQQLWFLKACASNGFYPPTIEGVQLPTFMQHRRFTQEVESIKASLFSKLKRHIYAERQINTDHASGIVSHLASSWGSDVLQAVHEARSTAYRLSAVHHEERLHRRLAWLLRRHTRQDGTYEGPPGDPDPAPTAATTTGVASEQPGSPTPSTGEDHIRECPPCSACSPLVRVMTSDHMISLPSFPISPSGPNHSFYSHLCLPSSLPLGSHFLPNSDSSFASPDPLPAFHDLSQLPHTPSILPTLSDPTTSLPPELTPTPISDPPASLPASFVQTVPVNANHPDRNSPLNPLPVPLNPNPTFIDPVASPNPSPDLHAIPLNITVPLNNITSQPSTNFSPNNVPDLAYYNYSHFIDPDLLVTDLTGTLSREEKLLLSKGPKFALSQPVNDKAKRDATINFCRLANELRWREHWRRNDIDVTNTELPKYPHKDELIQPPKYADFERKLTRINEVINSCLNSVNRGKASNLLPTERRTLAQLKKKNLQCLPSDKGGEFCVIERSRYIEIGNEHLSNSNIYTEIPSMSPKTIELKVNKVWKTVAKRNNLDFSTTKRYVSNNTDLAKFYFLIKTHKSGNVPKIRPIVSNINCPTTKISWLLDKALKPLLQHVTAHIENTSDLINRLKSLASDAKQTYIYPFSLDVVNLFTAIPQQGVITVLEKIMSECSYSFHKLNCEDIIELLQVTLDNNYFTFENKIYKQNHGLAMGSSVSAILAILFMGHVESIALNNLGTHVGFYTRYVDDVLVLARNREESEHIHNIFNNTEPCIKFEIEHPNKVDNTNVLKLLDISLHVSETGEMHYDFYRKNAKKPIFVNYKSALPMRSKMNYIKNERNRISNNCFNDSDAELQLSKFNSILKINEYPEKIINNPRTFNNERDNRKHNRNQNKNFSYLNFPYITDGINRKITKCFQREGLNVRLYHRTCSLRTALKPTQNNNKTCNKRGCSLDNKLCLRKNVVYQITCAKCQGTYIGSTIRHLHDRVHEHFNNNNSSVNKHFEACGSSPNNMKVKIIDQENKKGNLRIREAFHINKLNPTLNSKEESAIDLILF